MPNSPISPVMLSEQIKEVLLDQIIKGEIRPGERLVESRIAAQMQTSQAPVRDAIRELGMVGIVEMRRNKGAVVRAFDREELAQIYAVRAELEGMAVELAAQLDAPTLGAELGNLCERMETATSAGRIAGFVKLSGAEFDKAYAENELAYHKAVNDLVENTMIPNIDNEEVRALFVQGLEIFKAHEHHAEMMVKALK